MGVPYPRHVFFPRSKRPPQWVEEIAAAFRAHEGELNTQLLWHKESNVVLAMVRQDLEDAGFEVEAGKKKSQKIRRPVSFGEMGEPEFTYEIDAYRERPGVVLEVEGGRFLHGGAIYRDIIEMSLMVDAKYAAIAGPLIHRSKRQDGKTTETRTYEKAKALLEAIYTSARLRLPFEGILLLGY